MSEAVEIVATAIRENCMCGEDYTDYEKVARAAIQALRTPNESILKILREGIVMDGYEPHPGQAEKIWDRCIDAALKESP